MYKAKKTAKLNARIPSKSVSPGFCLQDVSLPLPAQPRKQQSQTPGHGPGRRVAGGASCSPPAQSVVWEYSKATVTKNTYSMMVSPLKSYVLD